MAEPTLTCSEVLNQAEANRRHVMSTLTGKALEKELAKADEQVQRAHDRHDCI